MNRVPREQILRSSPVKMLGLSVGCLAFTAIGMLMIRDGELLGWLVAPCCALGALLFAAMTLPGACRLRLTREGFEIRTLWRTSGAYRWDDVERFYAGTLGVNKAVMFDFSATYGKQQTARAVAKAIGGAEGALPDTYGMSVEALAALLNRHLDAARSERETGGS